MAKKLEACKAEYLKLHTTAMSSFAVESRATQFDGHALRVLEGAAKAIGDQVQSLKDKGATGTSLKDFEGDAEVKKSLKVADDLDAAAKTLEAEYKTERARFNQAQASYQGIMDDLRAEVDHRKKKKAGFFKVESNSLPDLEKLLAEMSKDVVLSKRWAGTMFEAERYSKRFNKFVDIELAQTKTDRAASAEAELDERGLDTRIVRGKLGRTQTLFTTVQGACQEVTAAVGKKDAAAAKAAYQKASAAFKELDGMAIQYDRAYKANDNLLAASKDGPEITKSIQFMVKANDASKAELTKAGQALKGLLTS